VEADIGIVNSLMGSCSHLLEIWDRWKDSMGNWIRSCSILTTTPNAVTSSIHDRMPVILNRNFYEMWLDPGMNNVELVSELLKPYDANLMRCFPVNPRVNNVMNDDIECSAPWKPVSEPQGQLFS
jgi:putative SOS response-associated peptidase YedK